MAFQFPANSRVVLLKNAHRDLELKMFSTQPQKSQREKSSLSILKADFKDKFEPEIYARHRRTDIFNS